MRIPDANVLLYAIDPAAHRHQQAMRWVEGRLSGDETIGLAWVTLLSVLRLTTNPAIYEPALEAEEALDLIDGWIAQPAVTIVDPTERHSVILRSLLAEAGTAGNLTSDAHLAAIAIERSATLATFDGDFHRFSGLKLEYLAAP